MKFFILHTLFVITHYIIVHLCTVWYPLAKTAILAVELFLRRESTQAVHSRWLFHVTIFRDNF